MEPMIAQVHTIQRLGRDYFKYVVECEVTDGIGIHLVSVSDNAVQKCLLRVLTAIQASEYRTPGKKIVINVAALTSRHPILAPDASALDLPMALALLLASGQIKQGIDTEKILVVGELGLAGDVRTPEWISGYDIFRYLGQDFERFILPFDTATQAVSFAPDNFYYASTLKDAIRIVETGKDDDIEDLLVWNTPRWAKLLENDILKPTKTK